LFLLHIKNGSFKMGLGEIANQIKDSVVAAAGNFAGGGKSLSSMEK
jgi:hypothetical protein